MGLISYFRNRKAAKERALMLKNTPHMERIWLFRHQEFVEYCDRNNAYVFCVARAVDIVLYRNKENVDEERFAFNKTIVERFTRMVSHAHNQVRVPYRPGNDPKMMKPHPLERGRINNRIYDGLTAMKQILDPTCSMSVAQALADRYITDPYQEEKVEV